MKYILNIFTTIFQTINKIVMLFRRCSSHFLQRYILMMLILSLISFIHPVISGMIVVGLGKDQIGVPLILFIVQTFMALSTRVVSARIGKLLENIIKTDLQMDFVRSLLKKTISSTKGEVLTSFHNDTSTIAHLGRQVLLFYCNVVISLVSGLGLLFFHPSVFVLGVAGVVAIVWISYRMNISISNYALKKHQLYSQYSEKLSNVAAAYEELKVQNIHCKVLADLEKMQEALEQNDVQCDTRIETPGRIVDVILGIIPVVGYTIGGLIFRENIDKIGVIVTTTAYLTNFISKSSFWAYLAVLCEPLSQSLERINTFLVDAKRSDETTKVSNTLQMIERVEATNLSFSYTEGCDVIENMNFTFSGNGLIALLGKSGSGKSTLLKVLLQAIIPVKGEIFVNGIPLCEIKENEWREKIGYLHQSGNLFNGTIRENILLFNENPDYLYIDEIASTLNIKKELGEDYLDVAVMEGSGGISTGQKDRIRLLCVLSTNPQMLLLDEPGANLDHKCLVDLYDYLKRLSDKMMIFCASHDNLLTQYCDHIIYFQ